MELTITIRENALVVGLLLLHLKVFPPIRAIHPSTRGGYQGCTGSLQGTRGGSSAGRMGSRSGSQPGGRRGQLYAVPARHKVESSDTVITGTILVCRQSTLTLFDLGFTYSYVSAYYAPRLELS